MNKWNQHKKNQPKRRFLCKRKKKTQRIPKKNLKNRHHSRQIPSTFSHRKKEKMLNSDKILFNPPTKNTKFFVYKKNNIKKYIGTDLPNPITKI